MAKAFNPFEDDDGNDELEFQPDGATTITEAPRGEPKRRVIEERTAIKPQPKTAAKPLRIDFDELSDQGGDIRGATAIGSDGLAADEFLSGMKRTDYDNALARAKASQRATLMTAAQDTRIGRTVKTPIYLLIGGIVLFIGTLIAGGFVFKGWWEYRERVRLEQMLPGQLK